MSPGGCEIMKGNYKGRTQLEEDECYCKLCSALTKKDHEIQLYKGRLANFCRDCWNQLLTKSIPEIRELLRKRND